MPPPPATRIDLKTLQQFLPINSGNTVAKSKQKESTDFDLVDSSPAWLILVMLFVFTAATAFPLPTTPFVWASYNAGYSLYVRGKFRRKSRDCFEIISGLTVGKTVVIIVAAILIAAMDPDTTPVFGLVWPIIMVMLLIKNGQLYKEA